MSIEETYGGQWSSDLVLLKSLLDGGHTIIGRALDTDQIGILTWFDGYFWRDNHSRLTIIDFLDPRPRVLGPKPLRWCMLDAFSSDLKARDEWKTPTGSVASGRIRYIIEARLERYYWRIFNEGDYGSHAHGYCDTQEDAISAVEKWRKDHLEMPVFKCESELVLEPKPLVWKSADSEEEEVLEAIDGEWEFWCTRRGSWGIKYNDRQLAHRMFVDDTSFEIAFADIHEWRVNHLKSMIQ